MGNNSPKPVEKKPILPGPASAEHDMVNGISIPAKNDRSKQAEKRGKTRDYQGRDKYRHFDEDAARNPGKQSEKKQSK
tara:strand:- start:226 stop:459 length:234 start_codon:yes stop_codon:yes gene_type:complete